MHPKMLFLRYAFACTEDLLQRGKITEPSFNELKMIVDNPTLIPGDSVLQECFPTACANIRSLGERNGREVWSMENVADFWRNHHGNHRTPVEILMIDMVRADGFVRVADAKPRFFHNRYGLDVREGDSVRTHVSLIIEKI
ncbi:MAG: hypothetical protein KBD19_04135 [Candidatus Moranbacteria bacterium]|nr:hypothetical protein [Candidatus Moranbacteria bacterium]